MVRDRPEIAVCRPEAIGGHSVVVDGCLGVQIDDRDVGHSHAEELRGVQK